VKELEKYFNPRAFVALGLVMPAAMIIFTFFLGAINIHAPYEILISLQRSHYLFSIAILMCISSLFISFIDLLILNLPSKEKQLEPVFTLNKSYFNIALISFPYFYFIIIVLFLELEKFGNIPVGRN
jgi:hypothetical protein